MFRVELATGLVTLMTAELDAPTIDVFLHGMVASALFATPRGVYRYVFDGLHEVLELARGEELTGVAYGDVTALFVRGPEGARLFVGPHRRIAVRLPSTGYAPRFS